MIGTSSVPVSTWVESSRRSSNSVVSPSTGWPRSSTSQIRSAATSITTPRSAPTATTSRDISSMLCSRVAGGAPGSASTKALIPISSTPSSPIIEGTTSDAGEFE